MTNGGRGRCSAACSSCVRGSNPCEMRWCLVLTQLLAADALFGARPIASAAGRRRLGPTAAVSKVWQVAARPKRISRQVPCRWPFRETISNASMTYRLRARLVEPQRSRHENGRRHVRRRSQSRLGAHACENGRRGRRAGRTGNGDRARAARLAGRGALMMNWNARILPLYNEE